MIREFRLNKWPVNELEKRPIARPHSQQFTSRIKSENFSTWFIYVMIKWDSAIKCEIYYFTYQDRFFSRYYTYKSCVGVGEHDKWDLGEKLRNISHFSSNYNKPPRIVSTARIPIFCSPRQIIPRNANEIRIARKLTLEPVDSPLHKARTPSLRLADQAVPDGHHLRVFLQWLSRDLYLPF